MTTLVYPLDDSAPILSCAPRCAYADQHGGLVKWHFPSISNAN